jgi:hypothetical protein
LEGHTHDPSELSVAGLRDLITTLANERQERVDERFIAAAVLADQRFMAQEKAVSAALAAQKEAVAKADLANEKRFESVNEFRAQLADQAARLLPRAEAEVEHRALRELIERNAAMIAALSLRIERSEGQRGGLRDGWGYLVGAAGFVATLIAIAYALAK